MEQERAPRWVLGLLDAQGTWARIRLRRLVLAYLLLAVAFLATAYHAHEAHHEHAARLEREVRRLRADFTAHAGRHRQD